MSEFEYIEEAANVLFGVEGVAAGDFEGASAAELDSLGELLPGTFKLPPAIREWLAFAGVRSGGFFRTRDLSFRSIYRLIETRFRDCRDPLLMEDEDEFEENLLIFYENQAMFIAFCRLDEGDDPPVYIWDESMDGIEDAVRRHDAFSAYLLDSAQTHKTAIEYRP
jgi:hypothetical protein